MAFLQAQWTYTGYDASAHVAEETVLARLNSAWGVFLSVAVSSVVGYIVLMAFTLNIPNGDVAATALDPFPVLYIAREGLIPLFCQHRRCHRLRRHVAVRSGDHHQHEPHVLRLRP